MVSVPYRVSDSRSWSSFSERWYTCPTRALCSQFVQSKPVQQELYVACRSSHRGCCESERNRACWSGPGWRVKCELWVLSAHPFYMGQILCSIIQRALVMVYTRASASDYDTWEAVYENPGWGSKQLIPLLKEVNETILSYRKSISTPPSTFLDRDIHPPDLQFYSREGWPSQDILS